MIYIDDRSSQLELMKYVLVQRHPVLVVNSFSALIEAVFFGHVFMKELTYHIEPI